MKQLIIAASFMLAACGGGGHVDSTPTPPVTAGWEAGPTIPGYGNYSAGTVLNETADGIAIDVPQQGAGSTHYVTRSMSLAGKSAISVQGSVELADGAHLYPVKDQSGGQCDRCGAPTIMALYFEQAPNDWQTDGQRWYFAIMSPIEAGPNFDITVPLDDRWGSVFRMTAKDNPDVFARALAASVRVGVVFGGGDGLGHGIYAVGPARITFQLEAH